MATFVQGTGQVYNPSPSTPVPIHNVSGDNTIEICGKNLFNDYRTTTLTPGGLTISGVEDGVEVNGTFNRTASIDIWLTESRNNNYNNLILLEANTTYTINVSLASGTFTSNYNITCALSSRTADENKTFNYNYQALTQNGNVWSVTFTTGDSNIYGAGVRFTLQTNRITTFNNAKFHIQLEKGSATTYEAYTGQSQLISLGNIELNKISTYQDYIYKDNDRWFLHKEIGKVVFKGGEDESWGQEIISGAYNYYINVSGSKGGNNYPILNNIGNYRNNLGANYATYISAYHNLNFRCNEITSTANFKTMLSSTNMVVCYVLDTPTDTEITDTTLLEQLNNLMTLPLYKNLTHITLTPNDLQPTMKIEYYRDTSLNENFVPKEDMTKYYTKVETDAQILINSSSIQQIVAETQTTLDSNSRAINTVSSQVQSLQSSTSLEIQAINNQIENGVAKLTNSLVKIDTNGINTSRSNETFNTQITNKTFEVKDGDNPLVFIGYKEDEQRTVAQIPELEARQATIGVHRTETIYEDGEYWTAEYYVGGGS